MSIFILLREINRDLYLIESEIRNNGDTELVVFFIARLALIKSVLKSLELLFDSTNKENK